MSTNRALSDTILDSEECFNCIECLTPSVTLFRQISPSSPSSIKLTKCIFCRKDVDPYIEREWILVFLDVLLHRLSANRHFYLHRMRNTVTSRKLSSTSTTGRDDGLCTFSLFSLHNSNVSCIFYALVITILDVYLKWQANASTSDDIQPKQIAFMLTFSFVQLWVQVSSIFLLSSYVILPLTQKLFRPKGKRFAVAGCLHHKIFYCLSIPVFYMKLLVSSILIWENSSVVQGLGALLTYSQQYLSLFCIIEHEIVMIIFLNWRIEQQKLNAHTQEDWSYCVHTFLKQNVSQSDTSLLKRGFLLNNTGTVSAMCLLSLVASIILQFIVSIVLSQMLYVPLCRGNSSDILLCIG